MSSADLILGRQAPLVIAEVANAHDGSLGAAHAFIDAAARAGADAIKFQTHVAAAESTPAEPWRVRFSYQDETRYDYWRRMEFTEPQWRGLKQHADERELLFLSSPFSIEAVELLERVGVPAWKVASGEVSNRPLLERIVATGKPVLLSSGMSPWSELDEAVAFVRGAGCDLLIFQCTTMYPTPADRLGLNLLGEMRARYGCPVGLSDHSGDLYAGLGAVALGADALEVHLTLSREAFGPDTPASLTPDDLRRLVEGARFLRRALAHPLDKDAMAGELAPLRGLFTKSLALTVSLPAGTVLTRAHLTAKKPGSGIPAARLPEFVGRTLARDVRPDELLAETDFVPPAGG